MGKIIATIILIILSLFFLIPCCQFLIEIVQGVREERGCTGCSLIALLILILIAVFICGIIYLVKLIS